MACGGCRKKREISQMSSKDNYDVLGGYKYLPERQLKARLETYKRINCTDCNDRYKCDYNMYTKCKGK